MSATICLFVILSVSWSLVKMVCPRSYLVFSRQSVVVVSSFRLAYNVEALAMWRYSLNVQPIADAD